MAAFKVTVALALFAFVQVSYGCVAGYGGLYGNNFYDGGCVCGESRVVDVDTSCVPTIVREPVTEVTTLSCTPVVETFVQPGCGNGYVYDNIYGDYGYPGFKFDTFYAVNGYPEYGYENVYGGYGYHGYGYENFYGGCGYPGYGFGECGCGESFVVDVDTSCVPTVVREPVTTVSCVPVVETFVQPGCSNGYGYDIFDRGYGYPEFGIEFENFYGSYGYPGFGIEIDNLYGGYGYPGYGYENFDGGYGYPGNGYGNFYGDYGYPGYGYGGCESRVVDVDTYIVPVRSRKPVTEITTVSCVPVIETFVQPGCGNGYGYDNFYGGYGYPGFGIEFDNFYGDYGYPRFGIQFDNFYGGYGYPSYGYENFDGGYGYPRNGYGNFYGDYGYPGYGYGGCESRVVDVDTYTVPVCSRKPVTEITTVSCVPVVETFVQPGCGNGYGYDNFYGGYGYPGFGIEFDNVYGGYGYPGFGIQFDNFYGGYGYPSYGYENFYGDYGYPGYGYEKLYDSYGYPGYGYGGYGCGESLVFDVDTFCVPTVFREPITEITTVSCLPVETFIQPGCGKGYGYNSFYGGDGYPVYGFDKFYGRYEYPGYGFDIFYGGCGFPGYGFDNVYGGYGYPGYGINKVYGGFEYGYPGYGVGGYGCGEAVVVVVDTFCAHTGSVCGCGCGRKDCCCSEPVTEVTTVSCAPVVETFIQPECANGYGYDNFYGGYGYPGYGFDNFIGGYVYP